MAYQVIIEAPAQEDIKAGLRVVTAPLRFVVN
jgi:hypothetical protein